MMNGKVMLILGASSGIGRETALAAGARGASVVVASRRERECQQIVEEIESSGGTAIYVATDISALGSVSKSVDKVLHIFGRLDCAANVAGVTGQYVPLDQGDPNDWDCTMATNLKGVWLAMKAQAAAMGSGGAIVNVSSWMADGGMELTAPYTASKAGLQGMSRALAVELAAQNIRVNVVAPGVVLTPMAEQFGEGLLKPFRDHTPLGRLASPLDVAEAILWLCSDASRSVTGQILGVDGGYSIAGHRGLFP